MSVQKKIKVVLIITASVLLLSAAGILITYYIIKPDYNSTGREDVTDQIKITRNRDGVPRVTVSSKDDLFFALGYVHASDRLNSMEYQRALANGTASRFIKNSDGRTLDDLASIIGFTKEAESLLPLLNEEIINALNNYVKGINHIKRKKHLLRVKSDSWEPADILSILIMKEWTDAFLSNSRLFFTFNISKKPDLNRLFPDVRYFNYYNDDEKQYIYILVRVKNLIEKYAGIFNRGYAAYIDSSLNSSDDRDFTIFSYTSSYGEYPGWYPVNIQLGADSISAITYSGLPFFFTYRNKNVSMTHFTVNADSQNFILLNTRKSDGMSQYNINGSWKDFISVRVPLIKGNEALHALRRKTDKGPILSDLIPSDKHDERILCVSSALPGPDYISILCKAPFETDIKKVREQILRSDAALKSYIVSSGAEAFKIYAGYASSSRTGNSVLHNSTQIPGSDLIRITSVKPINGSDFAGSDLTPAKDIPVIQPERIITNDLRLKKIAELLPRKRIYNENIMQEILSDSHSGAADIFIPVFRQMLDLNPLTSAKLVKIYFNEWDFTARSKLQAPSIFYLTLNNLINETFRDELGNDTDPLIKYSYLLYNDYYTMFQKNTSMAFDNIKTDNIETREMIFDKAFLGAMRSLNRKTGPLIEKWKWGEHNKNYYKIHNLSSGLYAKFFRLTETTSNGGPDSALYTSFDPEMKPVDTTSLTGYIAEKSFKFRANFSYSTLILSDFYYGRSKKISSTELTDGETAYTTIINKR